MKFWIRKLRYSPDAMEKSPATVAVFLFDRAQRPLAAFVREELASLKQRFSQADKQYLEALRGELTEIAADPTALHKYIRDNFNEASMSITLSELQPLEAAGAVAAKRKARAMILP